MSHLDNLLINLERLEEHLNSVKSGSLVAKDDLASVLHILVNNGEGYDLIKKTLEEISASDLNISAFKSQLISRKRDGLDIRLAIRTANITSSYKVALGEMLKQEVIYHDNSVWSAQSSLNWSQIIAKSRNKHGSHVDDGSIAWLKDLRYYPAANSDVLTLLLWSFGEALLEAITKHLVANGVDITIYHATHSLNGINFQTGMLTAESANDVRVAATVALTEDAHGNRTIFGGIYGDQAFILGVNSTRQTTATIGKPGVSLEDIEHEFITGQNPAQLNRAQRRAQRKQ